MKLYGTVKKMTQTS